jgi:hypothetical protein
MPALERLRAATRLPRCSFESNSDLEPVALPPLRSMFDLARALAVEGRVLVADGDVRGAMQDFAAMERLAEHISQTPVMISSIASVAIRSMAFKNLPFALSSRALRSIDLENFDPTAARPAREIYLQATRMEEAYILSWIGRAKAASGPRLSLIIPRVDAVLRPAEELAQWLYFDDEIAGYRSAMEDARKFCDLSPADAKSAEVKVRTARAMENYERGILATKMAPSLEAAWVPIRRSDCERDLARCALAATRFRLEHGAYPTKLEDLPSLPTEVRWEGDAQKARFDSLDPLLEDNPPSIQLD